MKLSDSVRKTIISMAAILIIFLSLTSVLNHVFGQSGILGAFDRKANQYLSDATKRAATAFVIARGINATISVFQNTSVNAQPGGIGVTAGVGQILDPVDDLVEQLSSIMLLSTISLGIQKILMDIGNVVGFKILLSISMMVIIVGIWFGKIIKLNIVSFGYKILIASILVRFLIPTIAVVSGSSYENFLSIKYNKAIGELERSSVDFIDVNLTDDKPGNNSGTWEKVKDKYSGILKSVDINAKLKRVSDIASSWSEYIFNLMEVFIIQTILAPLLVLYGMIKLFNKMVTSSMFNDIKKLT